mmetsp:Transcript_32363/g.77699  ORF Transcript_32363/g.77699 Transcript_32363/m.77699 type:complete len:102 (+) Transcript_32363:10-315(+)
MSGRLTCGHVWGCCSPVAVAFTGRVDQRRLGVPPKATDAMLGRAGLREGEPGEQQFGAHESARARSKKATAATAQEEAGSEAKQYERDQCRKLANGFISFS